MWKNKYQVLEEKKRELQKRLQARDEEDRRSKRPKGQEDLFSSCSCDDSQTVAVLRGRAESMAKEQALTTETYEAYILKLREHFRVHGVPFPDALP